MRELAALALLGANLLSTCAFPSRVAQPPLTADLSTAPVEVPLPPIHYRLVADTEPVEEVLVAWEGNWDYAEYFVDLTRAITEEVPVRLVGAPEDADVFAEYLLARGVAPERLRRLDQPVDTMWIRDYGPLYLRGIGDLVLVDLPYHPDRLLDDELPVALSAAQHHLRLAMKLPMEGAHLSTDGEGRCVVSENVLWDAGGLGIEEPSLREQLATVFGCLQTVFVAPLLDEETGHVDTFALIHGPGRILVGSYARREDPQNADVLDEDALRLEEAGFDVTRIPMPRHSRRTNFRTYTNVLLLDRSVIVPVFEGSRRHEREALRELARAFPRRRVVPVESESVMSLGGAIHCTTRPVPRLPPG